MALDLMSQLEIINTTTGQPTFTWPELPYEYQGQGLSSIDAVHGIFYIIGPSEFTAKSHLHHRY